MATQFPKKARSCKGTRKNRRGDVAEHLDSPECFQRSARNPSDFFRPVRPMNERQATMMDAIDRNVLVFATGAAGTGKTKQAVGYAAQALQDGRVDKVYLIRPAVAVDENLGFLPGEIEDKYEPYFRPFREHFNACFGPTYTEYLRKKGILEALPVGFCRGLTFGEPDQRVIVIIDEAQNTTPEQMKMLLTRIGANCKVIITGDVSQSDLRQEGLSGLEDAAKRLNGTRGVGVIRFQNQDCVRSEFCKAILSRYDN